MKTNTSALSQPVEPPRKTDGDTSEHLVRTTIDLANPPPLSAEALEDLERLRAMKDEDIDYSDIPPLDDTFWKHAVRNPFYRPTKTSTTVRIDSDVLAWLRGKGRGYQTRLNEILRRAMLDELKAR